MARTDKVAKIARTQGSTAHPKTIGKTVAAAPADQASAPVKGMRTQKDAAKQLAKPRGGKPGQALRNQSAQYSAEEQNAIKDEAKSRKPLAADKINSVKATTSGPDYIVVKAGDRVVNVPRNRMTGELTKIAVVGGSLKAVEAYIASHKPDAKLGRGITGRDAPQSSKAVADQRHVAKAEPAPTGKTERTAKVKEAKTVAKRGSKMDPATKLTVVTTAAKSGLKQGSDRYLRLQAVEGAKTLGAALERTIAGGKRIAMDNIQGMIKRGHVKLG